MEFHWNIIYLRAWLRMTFTLHLRVYTTLHDFGGVLGRPLDTFYWALTISRSQLWAPIEVALNLSLKICCPIVGTTNPTWQSWLLDLYCKLPHSISNYKSCGLTFQVVHSKLRCIQYKRWKWRFQFSFSGHIGPPNCARYWTYN